MWLQGAGSILLAAGIPSVVAATPFRSQISLLLHTFVQLVEGLYDKFPFLEEYCQNLARPSKKGPSCGKLTSLSAYCQKNSFNSMVFYYGSVPRHISYVKKNVRVL